jgi:hypothetical protein
MTMALTLDKHDDNDMVYRFTPVSDGESQAMPRVPRDSERKIAPESGTRNRKSFCC